MLPFSIFVYVMVTAWIEIGFGFTRFSCILLTPWTQGGMAHLRASTQMRDQRRALLSNFWYSRFLSSANCLCPWMRLLHRQQRSDQNQGSLFFFAAFFFCPRRSHASFILKTWDLPKAWAMCPLKKKGMRTNISSVFIVFSRSPLGQLREKNG